MKTVVVSLSDEKVLLAEIPETTPIFAKHTDRERKICGMIVKNEQGWCLNLGGSKTSTGHSPTRDRAVREAITHGYTFHVE